MLNFGLLGPLDVARDGQRIVLTSAKLWIVLAGLLVRARPARAWPGTAQIRRRRPRVPPMASRTRDLHRARDSGGTRAQLACARHRGKCSSIRDCGELAGHADHRAYLVRTARQVVAPDAGLTAVRGDQRGQDVHRGGLAGAVGAEQGEDRSRGNVQVDARRGQPCRRTTCAVRWPRSPAGVGSLSCRTACGQRGLPRFQAPGRTETRGQMDFSNQWSA